MNPSGLNVLMVEPHANGHHGPYLQWMTVGLLRQGHRVTVATLKESLTHPSIQALAKQPEGDAKKPLRFVPLETNKSLERSDRGVFGLINKEFSYWRLFRDFYRKALDIERPDVVFVPYLDYCLYAFGMLGSPFGNCGWAGVAMRPSFHYREMGVVAPTPALAPIKKALFFRALRNRHLRCLLTIDEPLSDYLSSNPRYSQKVAFLPEPVNFSDLPDSFSAKRHLEVPTDRKLILVYGAISARKGVAELFNALADPRFCDSIDVLLAGKISQEIGDLLASPTNRSLRNQGRIHMIDRFIDSNEEPALFAAADIVWLGYRGHYTASGVLVQAAKAKRPVLACKEGIIGWQTRRHNLGKVVNPADTKEVISAIDMLTRYGPSSSFNAIDSGDFVRRTLRNAQTILAGALQPRHHRN